MRTNEIPKNILSLLDIIFMNDNKKIQMWYECAISFHGLSPKDMVLIGRSDEVFQFLQSYLDDSQIFRG